MKSRSTVVAALLLCAACSSSPAGPSGAGDLATAPGAPDLAGGAPDDLAPPSGPDGGGGGTYRNALAVCWTDATCPRALAVSHGGDWSTTGDPYLSDAALAAAYDHGADAVKIDVRVTMDNVPVLAHSSPIQIYESLDCYNKKIEEMTAAEVTGCHRLPSTTQTFQRLDTVLAGLRGRLVVQLTVKLTTDYARVIQEVLADGAEGYAFFEVTTSDLQTLLPSITGADRVYYLVQIGQLTEVDTLIDTIKNPRAFMYEFDPATQLGTLVTQRLHPAGVRAFTYVKDGGATQASLKALYDAGYDVVSSNVTGNNVAARIQVNQARGVTPP